MGVEVCTVSGFTKTAGNSTAIKVDDEVIILDMGLGMENYIRYSEDREDVHHSMNYEELLKVEAVPDYHQIDDWQEMVKAIIPSHGHLDHVGAVPFGAPLFPNAPVIGTPYTIEILRSILKDDKVTLPNKLIAVNLNSTFKISENITIELVNVTHSIPHAALVVIHTKYGKIIYANDYKFDRQPTLGKKPNFERLRQLGDEGVLLLVVECLYADKNMKMPSESVAKQMLKDVMLGVNSEGKGMIVTTFSSHIARLKSIIEMGKKLNRKIVFIGRSLQKYVRAAENVQIVDFKDDISIIRHRDKIERLFARINREGKDKYLIVCTGHQGEPRAVLSRIARGELHYNFDPGDLVIFSCSTIPVELNIQNRQRLESMLRKKKLRIFTDVHVSGHAAIEDHRDLFELVKPKNIIPAHAGGDDRPMLLRELAKQLGFKKTHIMNNGKRLKL